MGEDPKRRPGAYVTDGKLLYEVVQVRHNGYLVVQNCITDGLTTVAGWRFDKQFELVRAAELASH